MIVMTSNAIGESCPMLLCDVCREPITSRKSAMAIWGDVLEPGAYSPVKHVHKGDCRNKASELIENHSPHSNDEELSIHLKYLVANADSGK
jgi:hypothetical protein